MPPPPHPWMTQHMHTSKYTIYNNQLLTYTDYTSTPNPPLPLAQNVWRQITSTTDQLWEVHLRNDLAYYHTARHKLHGRTDTIDGFHMAISLRYLLYLAPPPYNMTYSWSTA